MRPSRAPLMAVACGPGSLACAGSLALAVVSPGLADRPSAQWAPWAVGLLIVGIPHGALDHRVGGLEESGRTSPAFLAGYVALMAAVLALWWWAPLVALVGFLAVAAFHFGQGDLYWSRAARYGLDAEGRIDAGADRRPAWRLALFLAARGLVPVVVPVLAFPEAFVRAADALTGRLFGDSARWSFSDEARTAASALMGVLIAAHLAALAAEAIGSPARSRRPAIAEAAGTALLVSLFAVAPPVLAMGVYFHAWHSVRHIGRLLPLAGATRESARRGRWLEAFARFHLAALPTSLAALAMMAVLGWSLRGRLGEAGDLGLAALALIAALTVPHVLVVLRLDRRQAVWPSAREARS